MSAKEAGDRAMEGKAYSNLGCVYRSQGDYAKAIDHHTQDLAPSPFMSGQLSRALLLALTDQLLDRIVTRRHRRA
jgi:tetratricopeptide (TPR) repeat protein